MAAALPVQQSQPGAWLPIDRAAERTGESVRNFRRRASGEASDAQRSGRKALAVMGAPPGGPGKPIWWIHRSFDRRLGYGSRDDRAAESLSARFPAHLVDRALRRHRWLERWRIERRDASNDREAASRVVAQARAIEAEDFRISERSILRWWREFNRMGDDGGKRGVEGLIDRYGACKASDTPDGRSPEAVIYFYEVYRSEVTPSIRLAHELTYSEANRQGWRWPKS